MWGNETYGKTDQHDHMLSLWRKAEIEWGFHKVSGSQHNRSQGKPWSAGNPVYGSVVIRRPVAPPASPHCYAQHGERQNAQIYC